MRLIAIAAILFLAGCYNGPPGPGTYVLVCSIDGRETYRSLPKQYWKWAGDLWSTRGERDQYKPSLMESCYTEVVQ